MAISAVAHLKTERSLRCNGIFAARCDEAESGRLWLEWLQRLACQIPATTTTQFASKCSARRACSRSENA